MVTVFHSQSSFKNCKTIQHVYDPTGVKDYCKIPQIVCKFRASYRLDLPENQSQSSLLVTLHTFGRCSQSTQKLSSVMLEKWSWDGGSTSKSNGRLPVARISSNACSTAFFKVTSGYFKALICVETMDTES
jgi:hypothetical protein